MKLSKKQFDKALGKNKYWNNRWQYISQVLELIGDEKEVLEIGCNGLQLVSTSDTFDLKEPATYVQDASLRWKLPKKYDLIIALQVWEHLKNPQQAFEEAKKYGKKIILSFPYEWKAPNDIRHNNITRAEIIRWTEKPKKEIRVNYASGYDRLICVY